MKVKHKQGHRRLRNPAAASFGGPVRGQARGFRSALLWITGIGMGVAVVWFGFSFWNKRGSPTLTAVEHGADRASAAAPPQAVRSGPRKGDGQEAVVAKVNQANELLAKGNAAEAVQVLTEAMQLNPNDEDVHYNLGLALTHLGRFDEAIQQYSEALRIFPNYVEAHNNLGNVLMRTGKTDEAIAHFEAAVKVMPDYASAHNNLGTALQRAGRTNEALLHFQQAAKLMPDYWQAHYNVATSLLQEGKLEDARGEFQTVLRLKPDFEPAKVALAHVESQRRGQ